MLCSEGIAERVTLVLFTERYVSPMQVDDTELVLVHRRPRRRTLGPGGMPDLGHLDVHAQTLATAGAALRYCKRIRCADLPARLVLAETGLRRDVAIAAPSMVLVSDRAFELLPLEAFLKLHRLSVFRQVMALLVGARLRKHTSAHRRARVTDMVAVHLAARWEAAVYHANGGLKKLLDPAAFLSMVDEVI